MASNVQDIRERQKEKRRLKKQLRLHRREEKSVKKDLRHSHKLSLKAKTPEAHAFVQEQQDMADRKRREAQAQQTQTLQMLEALQQRKAASRKNVIARWLSWLKKPSHRSE